jgi:hypothetical protein
MKHAIVIAGMIAAALGANGAATAGNVGVSINVGEPGFYGQIDVGNYPPPRVIYAQPVIVARPVHYVEQPPIYLRVPVGYHQHWERHCRAYNACGRRVFFVQDTWYANEYAPRYRELHGRPRDYRGPGGYGRDDHRGRPGWHEERRGDRGRDRHDDRGHDNRGNDHHDERGHDRGPDGGGDRGDHRR